MILLIFLEPITDGDEVTDFEEAKARIRIMNTAISIIEQESQPQNRMAAYDLLHEYDHLIRRMQMEYNSKETIVQFLKDEADIRIIGINAEIMQTEKMIINKSVSTKTGHLYIQQLNRRKRGLRNLWVARFNRLVVVGKRVYRQLIKENLPINKREVYRQEHQEKLNLERETAKLAIRTLSAHMKQNQQKEIPIDKTIAYHLIVEYRNKIERIKRFGEDYQAEYEEQLQELRLKALNAERGDIQKLYENGDISVNLAIQLRRFVNYRESSIMELGDEDD